LAYSVEYHELLLDGLPASDLYELSLMHREIVNNVITSSKTDFIITFSVDGHIKFWKKVFQLVDFVKNFKAHSGLITGAALSKNNDLLCSVGLDKTLKIFDVLNCDLKLSIRLNFVPSCCEFIPQEGKNWDLVAISEEKTGRIWIIDTEIDQNKEKIEDDEEVLGTKPN
jgi:peptidylprolyl isomerase domain and WD repeat-containing protein 1